MMRNRSNFVRLLLNVSGVAVAVGCSAPALAQTQPNTPTTPLPDQANPPPCPPGTVSTNGSCVTGQITTASGAPANESNSNAIVVTGSRIQRPNLQSPVPITSISQQELSDQGQANVGDALNDLPALRSTFSQQNSGRFIGTAGQNFLDLRGLGTNRTLVLVDGRRVITGSVGTFDVDVNIIPQDLIDRVDVVTGGESAVYGSDAVAGVVNFILKKDFDGFILRGQGGESKYGDRPIDFIDATLGKNFADGRGNVSVNLEYTHAGELFFRDRKHFSHSCGLQPNPADFGGANDPTTPSGDNTNGVPDNIFACNLRFVGTPNGGAVDIFGNGQDLSFTPTGDLVLSPVPDINFLPAGAFFVSSTSPLSGNTGFESGDLAVGQDRFSGAFLAHYDVSDALKPFIQATAVRQKAFEEFAPTFFEGDLHTFFEAAFGANVPSITCNNGFLNPQALATLTSGGYCSAPDANGFRSGDLLIFRNNQDLGARQEHDLRTTYRIVAGITGDFASDWHYEVSFNYGHTKQVGHNLNDLFVQNPDGSPGPFALALDAVAVVNGQIVAPGTPGATVECRSTLTNPGNGCVPLDLFGEGAVTDAARNFVNRTSNLFQSATQQDFLAYVSGDSGKWFSLPGGPVGVSVGVEHRRETAELHADAISGTPGGTFFNAFTPFNPPAFKVSEVFGELNVPILKDLPFVHELSVSGAARYSHYSLSGNTFAWNVNGIWAPTSDLRLRANYSKSVRAPTLNDLFQSPSVNFSGISDPCDQFNISSNPNFAANCAAAGVPTTVISEASPCFAETQSGSKGPVGSPFHNCIANSFTLQTVFEGNPALKPEIGKSLTAGGVFTPRFLPGFSFSADYFDIRITNLITTLAANTIVQQCFLLPSINNQFCDAIFPRDQFGLFASPAVIQQSFNFAKETSRGVDFDLGYRRNFANGHRLNLRGIATYTLDRMNFTDITRPNFGTRQLSTLGDPVFSGSLIAGYGIGKFDLKWTTRFIGSMTVTAFENTHQQPDACSTTNGVQTCPPFNSDFAERGHINTGAVWYHDVRLDYTLHNYNFYVGIDNLFNRLPPNGLTGAGGGSGIYENTGRFFYAGAVLNIK